MERNRRRKRKYPCFVERERFRAGSVEGGGRERGTKPVVEIGFGALAPESPSPGPFYAYRMHIEPLRGIACMDN